MKATILLLNFFVLGGLFGQNLVLNGDFENFSLCPTATGDFQGFVYDWINPGYGVQAVATPDYFNSCELTYTASVPYNGMGFQNAHSGSAYSGILIVNPLYPHGREYMEIPLSSALKENTCYEFNMYINLSTSSRYNSDDIGVYFSDTLIENIEHPNLLPYQAQVNNAEGNFPDTANWTLVSSEYTATGTEKFLLIGNFKDSASTTVVFQAGGITGHYAYFLIDDVSLTECASNQIKSIDENSISIYPVPFSDQFKIMYDGNENLELTIYDSQLRILLQRTVKANDTVYLSAYSAGVFYYRAIAKNSKTIEGRLIKQ